MRDATRIEEEAAERIREAEERIRRLVGDDDV
jgi:hypothetical protein